MALILAGLGLAVGAASTAYGVYNNQKAQSQSQQASYMQAQAAARQAELSANQAQLQGQFAGEEFQLQKTGAAQSLKASQDSITLNRSLIALEQQVQDQQRVAMQVGNRRMQLEIIRKQQRGRALALTAGVSNAGGSSGALGGSAIYGGYGQIQGQSGTNLVGANQALQRGEQLFSLAGQETQNKLQSLDLENLYALQRADLTTQRSEMMYRYAQTQATYNTAMAKEGGQISLGQGLINAAAGMASLGSSYQNAGSSIFNASLTAGKFFGSSGETGAIYSGDPTIPGFGPSQSPTYYMGPGN